MPFASFLQNLINLRQTEAERGRNLGPDIGFGTVRVPVQGGDYRELPIGSTIESRITMFPIASSNVEAIGYDPLSKVMRIAFKGKRGKGGMLYEYEKITPEFWISFVNAPSKGRFVQEVLRPMSRAGQIKYRKVSGPGGLRPSRFYQLEPPVATQPGGYFGPSGHGVGMPEGRLKRIARNRQLQQSAQPNAFRKARDRSRPWWRRIIG
jgi:hypothetical protein